MDRIRTTLAAILLGLASACGSGGGGSAAAPSGPAAPGAPATPVITAPATVSANATGLIASVPAQAGCTFTWTIDGGTITAGAATDQITFTSGASGSVQLSCVATNAQEAVSGAGTASCTIVIGAGVMPALTPLSGALTATVGQSVTVTVAATGTAPLAYQWSLNGTAISGANASTYTTPPLAAGDNGDAFTVLVSNAAGSATSTAVVVTVLPASTWLARGIGGGGAQYAPSISPVNPKEYYVSCDMSDLFHTSDFGASYVLLPSSQIQGGHYSSIGFTSDPAILYSLTYANGNWAMLTKSLDGGATWNLLPNDPLPYDDKWCLFADNTTTTRLVTSAYGAIYYTGDGGATFTNIYTAPNNGNGVVVAGVFFDGADIYLGTSAGMIVSTDGGASFSAPQSTPGLPAGQVIASFAGARTGSRIRFFALAAAAGNVYPLSQPGSNGYGLITGLYSQDGGSGTWTSCSGGIDLNNDYVEYIAMAQNDINTVYGGGSYAGGVPEVLKTSNAGQSWTNTFLTTGNQDIFTGWSGDGGDRGWGYGQNVYGIAVAPYDSSTAVITDEGFTHTTNDGGATWHQAYVKAADEHPEGDTSIALASYHSVGLEVTSCWQVMWASAQNLFAAFTDIQGLRSADGGVTWSLDYTGLTANTTYRIVQDPGTGTLYAGTSDIHDMYESDQLSDAGIDAADAHGDILFSGDSGATWNVLHHFGYPVFWVAQDPGAPHTMYASVVNSTHGGVYVTTDLQDGAASVWTPIANPSRAIGHPASLTVLKDGTLLASFSGQLDGNGNFTSTSGVFLYTPSKGTWADLSDPGMDYWTRDVVVDPSDATQSTWYAGVYSGWGGAPNPLGGLYRTADRGATWTLLFSGTDPVTGMVYSVTSLTQNPANLAEAYVTTETVGLWHTTNLQAAAPVFTRVLDYPFNQPLRVFYNPYTPGEVWVASFGDGMKMREDGTN